VQAAIKITLELKLG